MKPMPRASPGSVVTLDGDLYNHIAESLERMDKWTVQPPLNLQQTLAGNLLSMQRHPGEMVLVAVLTAESGGGRYGGAILPGNSTGALSDIFQLDPTTGQTQTDGPLAELIAPGNINAALIMNLSEPYVSDSHLLLNNSDGHPIYAIGRVEGVTSENPPRQRVYIDSWPLRPVIAQITQDAASGLLPESSIGGVYVGKILQGQFASDGNTYINTLAALAPSYLPASDNCWIINNWEQTNVYPQGATAGGTALAVGTNVVGVTAGFPLLAWRSRASSLDTFYMVYTWTPPQMPALFPAVHNITTVSVAGTSYGSTEQAMLNGLKMDVNNLHDSLRQLYINLQNAGYSR